jgi:hypothetical protein
MIILRIRTIRARMVTWRKAAGRVIQRFGWHDKMPAASGVYDSNSTVIPAKARLRAAVGGLAGKTRKGLGNVSVA